MSPAAQKATPALKETEKLGEKTSAKKAAEPLTKHASNALVGAEQSVEPPIRTSKNLRF